MPTVRPELPAADRGGRLLTAKEVAEMIGMTVDYVYALCRRDEIPHVQFGRSYRFRRESILRWLKQREHGPA